MQTTSGLHRRQVIFVMASLLVSACQPPNDAQVANDTVGNETAQLPRLPVAEAPLDREAILQMVAKAASAAALGTDDREAQRQLDGDRFEVRMRFGCPSLAPSGGTGPFGVTYEEERRRLQVRASPDLTEAEPWVAALGGEAVEAVEGFWMRKPWLLAPGCPVQEQATATTTGEDAGASTQSLAMPVNAWRVGIAQFFRATETRTTRRDHRPYETTKTLAEGQFAPSQGFDLIVSGRLRQLPNGRVIACHVLSNRSPPECVVSVAFDQVRIERADTQETLAEWSS